MYVGRELWRMYCVEWKTRKASPARKSRDERRPATGRSLKPVHAAGRGRRHRRGEEEVPLLCVTVYLLRKKIG